ncbi:hypothetical protein ACU686_44760 [Yinghuangia aomiensis]
MTHHNPLTGPEQSAVSLPATAVPCPTCHAEAGAYCTSHSGTRIRRTNVHQARTAACAEQPEPTGLACRTVTLDDGSTARVRGMGPLTDADRAAIQEFADAVQRMRAAEIGPHTATETADVDALYRERAHLVAFLAATNPAVLVENAPDAPGWAIVYVTVGPWQMTWHIAPADLDSVPPRRTRPRGRPPRPMGRTLHNRQIRPPAHVHPHAAPPPRPRHQPSGDPAAMIDAYAYTDADGNTLTVMALSATTNNPPHVQFAARNPAGVMSVWVPPTEVQDVIAGILSQSAAAQGRTWGSALAQARDDLTLYSTPRNGPGLVDVTMTDAFEALNRLMDQHMPLLLALAEAYTGQDGELWQQYRRVQAERDSGALRGPTPCPRPRRRPGSTPQGQHTHHHPAVGRHRRRSRRHRRSRAAPRPRRRAGARARRRPGRAGGRPLRQHTAAGRDRRLPDRRDARPHAGLPRRRARHRPRCQPPVIRHGRHVTADEGPAAP